MKNLLKIAAAIAIVATLALNVGVMVAPASAAVTVQESDTPCTDRYGHDYDLWCACMWGRYGYECPQSVLV